MKRRISLLIFILLFAFVMIFLASCGSNEEEGEVKEGEVRVLNVYNWGEYISDGSLGSYDTNAEFEAWYNSTHKDKVKIIYTTYATNEDMYAKISSGAGTYDVIIPSDYMIQKMAKEGLLLPFNVKEDIPNYEYIEDAYKGLLYDPEEKYSVPYTYGMTGIIYNATLIDEEDAAEESWGLLWNEKYKGKILQFNNPRDGFGSAMYYLNLDVNSKDPAVWQKALDKLLEQKPYVQGYVSDEIFNKMISASAAAAPYYAGDYITMADQNENLAFYYPKEGTNVFVDAMCIPKSARYPDLAKEYINFMLSEEAAVANALYIGYASPNRLVKESEDYLDEMGEEAYEILYKLSGAEANVNYGYDPVYYSFDDETQELVNSLWESLKTESAIEPWVHVVSGVIVVSLLAFGTWTVYLRKKRSKNYRLRDKEAAKAKRRAARSTQG